MQTFLVSIVLKVLILHQKYSIFTTCSALICATGLNAQSLAWGLCLETDSGAKGIQGWNNESLSVMLQSVQFLNNCICDRDNVVSLQHAKKGIPRVRSGPSKPHFENLKLSVK